MLRGSLYPVRRCELCGAKLDPCPSRCDGEDTYCGFYPCLCEAAREEEAERAEFGFPVTMDCR